MKKELSLYELNDFVVKIEYESPSNIGTGVIINPSEKSDYLYILTVKHLFSETDDDDVLASLDKESISINMIDISYKIQDKNINEKIEIDNFYFPDFHNDFVLFLVAKKKNKNIENIPIISILDSHFENCSIVGYPKVAEGNIRHFRCEFEYEKEGNLFEISPKNILFTFDINSSDRIRGLSGGGVFTRGNDQKIYLVGIQCSIQWDDFLDCINIQSLASKINNFLKSKSLTFIKVEDYRLIDELNIDINIEDFDYDKIEEKINSLENDYIKKFKEDFENLDSLSKTEFGSKIKDHGKSLRDSAKKVNSEMIKIADAYLYRAIICYRKGDSRKAKHNIRKAKDYNPNYDIPILMLEFYKDKKALIEKNREKITSQINKTLEEESFSSESRFEYLKSALALNKEKDFEFIKSIYEEIISVLNDDEASIVLSNSSIKEEKIKYIYALSELFLKNKKHEDAEQYLIYLLNVLGSTEINSISKHQVAKMRLKVEYLLAINYFRKNDFTLSEKYFLKALKKLNSIKQKNDKHRKDMINAYGFLMQILQKSESDNFYKIDSVYKKVIKIIENMSNDEIKEELSIKAEKVWRFTTSRVIEDSIISNRKNYNKINKNLLAMQETLNNKLDNIFDRVLALEEQKINGFFVRIKNVIFKKIRIFLQLFDR